jgi:hypothetical protein
MHVLQVCEDVPLRACTLMLRQKRRLPSLAVTQVVFTKLLRGIVSKLP